MKKAITYFCLVDLDLFDANILLDYIIMLPVKIYFCFKAVTKIKLSEVRLYMEKRIKSLFAVF